jgi:hypothetical protein
VAEGGGGLDLVGPVGELLKTRYEAWLSDQEARRNFVGILGALRDELRRNQLSLAEAANGRAGEQVEIRVYEIVAPVLRIGLQRSPELFQSITSVYTQTNPSVREQVQKGSLDEAKTRDLERLTRRAHRLLGDWLDREMPLELARNSPECRFQVLNELIQDFEDDEQDIILAKWHEFEHALASLDVRLVLKDEVDSQRVPGTDWEARLSEKIRESKYALDRYSLELDDNIHEVWIYPPYRILFTLRAGKPLPLVLVNEDGPTPDVSIQGARCRVDNLEHHLGEAQGPTLRDRLADLLRRLLGG